MSYDFKYYSGQMLRMPDKPSKPNLGRNPTATEARAFADALEEYEIAMKAYEENLGWYRSEKSKLLVKFQERLRADYNLSEGAFNVIWSEAWDRGHSGGLYEVYHEFDSLCDFITKWNTNR